MTINVWRHRKEETNEKIPAMKLIKRFYMTAGRAPSWFLHMRLSQRLCRSVTCSVYVTTTHPRTHLPSTRVTKPTQYVHWYSLFVKDNNPRNTVNYSWTITNFTCNNKSTGSDSWNYRTYTKHSSSFTLQLPRIPPYSNMIMIPEQMTRHSYQMQCLLACWLTLCHHRLGSLGLSPPV